jgi:signal transduction histidine kinase
VRVPAFVARHVREDPDATAAFDSLEAVLRECAERRSVPDTFVDDARPALATAVRSWRGAGLPEATLPECIAALGERLAASLPTDRGTTHAAGAAAAVLDGVQELVRVVERTFRSWRERLASGAALGTAVYAEVLGAELRNRLQAATTALELLASDSLALDERTRLESLLLDAIGAAVDSAEDVRHLSGEARDAQAVFLDLGDLLPRTVAQLASYAESRGVELRLLASPTSTPVNAAPFQILLYNVITMAVDRAASDSSAIAPRVSVATERTRGEATIELTVASTAVLPSSGDYDIEVVGPSANAAGREELSLWLTRESLAQLGGTMEVAHADAGGSVLRLHLPASSPTTRAARRGHGT